MIAVDLTPLVLEPRRGVARALYHLLAGWSERPPGEPLVLLAPSVPADLPDGILDHAALSTPERPLDSPRRFRRAIPALLAAAGADVLLSPWSAFPRVRVPVVCVVHELPFVRAGPLEGRLRALRHRWWLRRNVSRCAALITPSDATRDDLLLLHPGAADRVHKVPHGFDPAPWADVSRGQAPRPYVLMLGTGCGRRGARKKGLDVLLAARRSMTASDLGLVLVGRPDMALPPDVEVHEDVDDEAVRRLLAGARLLVYPSRSEGFGYPPLEAMAAGVPVVATRAGAIPEIAGEAALLVPPGDVSALAAAMARVNADPGLRGRLVEAGRARVRSFPPAAIAQRVGALLRAARGAP